MITFVLFMTLVTMITTPFISQSVGAQSTKTYENPQLGLRVPYPSNWDVELESERFYGKVSFSPKTGPSFIKIEVMPKTVEVEDLANALLRFYMKNTDYQNVELIDRERQFNLGGKVFYVLSIEFEGDLGQQGNLISITEANNSLYIFHLLSMTDDVAELSPVWENMLRSAVLSGLSGVGGKGDSTGSGESISPDQVKDTEDNVVDRQVKSNNNVEEDSDNSDNSEESGGSDNIQNQPQSVQEQQQPQQQAPQPAADPSGQGLNDACLKSGFSQEKCNNLLFSKDPGGYCTTLKIAGVDCPEIQDPSKTYGDPQGALQE